MRRRRGSNNVQSQRQAGGLPRWAGWFMGALALVVAFGEAGARHALAQTPSWTKAFSKDGFAARATRWSPGSGRR